MSAMIRHWAELKTTDFGDGGAKSRIALLPVAAIEQHGPHLPLGTDAYILDALIARLTGKVAADAEILVLPAQVVGESLEHADFPGTLTQDAETLIEAWTAIGEAAADAGLRKLAILNSHGGQVQIADIVAKRLRAERDMLVGRINTFLLGMPEGLFDVDERAFGYHGGEIETAMMLAIAPHLVDMKAAKDFPNSGAARGTLRPEGGAAYAWQAQDLNPGGATGNAARADAKRGEAALDYTAGRIAAALSDLIAFPLSDLRDGPN